MSYPLAIFRSNRGLFIFGLLMAAASFATVTYGIVAPCPAASQNAVGEKGKSVAASGQLFGGGTFSTTKWKGKVIVVDFWATWCPYCRTEEPSLEQIYSKYHHKGLEIIGVPIQSTAIALRSYLRKHPKALWPQIFDTIPGGNAILANRFGVSAFPAQFILDRHGKVAFSMVGSDPTKLKAQMRKLAADVRRLLNK
ncbi:MAG: TlpA disulfide reductase family protein [Acidocella sp.]|nr:TlpA disulfide reductase family protein [Acidocella sp.]